MNKELWEQKKQYRIRNNRPTLVNEIAPGIVIYDDVIPNSETLVNDIEEGMLSAQLEWTPAGVYSGDKEEGKKEKVDAEIRNTMKIGIPYEERYVNNYGDLPSTFFTTLSNMFLENFKPLEDEYMASYGIFSEWHDVYGILKYGVGQQFVNHIDDHPQFHRRVSTLYYLNDDYSGGEINFPRFDLSIKPKANQMIIFPSTYVYNHSVSPVTEGIRYSVVSWLR
jgi:hypothetical protein